MEMILKGEEYAGIKAFLSDVIKKVPGGKIYA